jgi:hypothetical protein
MFATYENPSCMKLVASAAFLLILAGRNRQSCIFTTFLKTCANITNKYKYLNFILVYKKVKMFKNRTRKSLIQEQCKGMLFLRLNVDLMVQYIQKINNQINIRRKYLSVLYYIIIFSFQTIWTMRRFKWFKHKLHYNKGVGVFKLDLQILQNMLPLYKPH